MTITEAIRQARRSVCLYRQGHGWVVTWPDDPCGRQSPSRSSQESRWESARGTASARKCWVALRLLEIPPDIIQDAQWNMFSWDDRWERMVRETVRKAREEA